MLFLLIGLVCISCTHAEKFKSFWLLTVYVKLLWRFSLYCLSFGSCSKHHDRCNIHLKSELITGQPALKLVVMTKFLDSSQTLVLVLRTKVFVNTILKHCLQTMFTKTSYIENSFSLFISHVIWKAAAVICSKRPPHR